MTEVIVLSVSAAKEECTCESMDIGVRYDNEHVEIPHFLMKLNRIYIFMDPGVSDPSEVYTEPVIPNKYYQDGLSYYQRVALISMLLLAAFTVLIVRRKMK